MGDSDFFAGFSRSVALDDFDEPDEESDEEATAGNKEAKLPQQVLPAWISWNPLIAEQLLKPDGPRVGMRFVVIGVGQKACDILESVIDIEKLDVNGALFLPTSTHACRPNELTKAVSSEPQHWIPLAQKHSTPDTNYIYTTVDMFAGCCLFHSAGHDGHKRGGSFDSYPVGYTVAKQLLDDSLNMNSLHHVIIFEVLPADRYIGERPASDLLSRPVTRCLRTSTFKGSDLPARELEPPNLVSGLSADLLLRCESLLKPASLLVCYSDASLNELLHATYDPLLRALSRTMFFEMRDKVEASDILRKISQRSKRTRDAEDLASLYI